MKSLLYFFLRRGNVRHNPKTSGSGSHVRGAAPSFMFRGQVLQLYVHGFNCGWPPYRMTERSVELSLADYWLSMIDSDVTEVGAVTPYYWPNRIRRVIDPTDCHRCVSDRSAYANVDCVNATILSISTFEHMGHGDYGLSGRRNELREAFEKLFRESERFLVTVPTGYNPHCDDFLSGSLPSDVCLTSLVRGDDENVWSEVDGLELRPYNKWANSVAMLTRGWPKGV